MKNELIESAKIALFKCLCLKRQEHLLVVCDPPCLEVGQALWEAGRDYCREAVMVTISPRKQSGSEPPDRIAELFGNFDVAVMPTSKSLSHTQARRNASAKGTRIATLPGITTEVFCRALKVDWDRLSMYTRRITTALSRSRIITITSKAGTSFTFKTGGREAHTDDGRIGSKGAFSNLPAGESYMAPLEGTAEGTLVFDGSFGFGGVLKKPLVLQVKKGKVVDVEDHPLKKELESLFDRFHAPARNIAEFGVGTNPSARVSGVILEDEKVLGTIHVAVGDNASMGGVVHVPLHLDGIMLQPTVLLDNKVWMEKGKLV